MLNAKSCYKHLASVKKKKRNRPPFFPPLLSPHTPYTIPPYNPPTRKEKKIKQRASAFFLLQAAANSHLQPAINPDPYPLPRHLQQTTTRPIFFYFFSPKVFQKKNSASCYHANMLQA